MQIWKNPLTAAHALLWESKRYKVGGGRAVTCGLMLWVEMCLPFLSRYVKVLTPSPTEHDFVCEWSHYRCNYFWWGSHPTPRVSLWRNGHVKTETQGECHLTTGVQTDSCSRKPGKAKDGRQSLKTSKRPGRISLQVPDGAWPCRLWFIDFELLDLRDDTLLLAQLPSFWAVVMAAFGT